MPRELTDADFEDTATGEPTKAVELIDGPGGDLTPAPEKSQTEVDAESDVTPTPEPTYKHKTWDETEKARIEAERKMHEATKAEAAVRKELERYQQALKNVQKQPRAEESFRSKVVRETHERISKINPDDPEAETKAAEMWAEAQEKIAQHVYETRTGEDLEQQRAYSQIEAAVKEKGFSQFVEIPGVGQVDIGVEAFWSIALSPYFPKGTSAEEQMNWVFGVMDAYNKGIIEAYEKKKTEASQGKQKILGRGGHGPVTKKTEPSTPSTLADDWKVLREKRKIQ